MRFFLNAKDIDVKHLIILVIFKFYYFRIHPLFLAGAADFASTNAF